MDIRRMPNHLTYALVAAHNAEQLALVSTTYFHLKPMTVTDMTDYQRPTEANISVSSANASDLTTSLALVNELKVLMNAHFRDDVAHDSAVSAEVTTVDATDLATAQTLANALKTAWNTHLSAANVHYNNDGTNAIAAANASNQGTLNTLLNEMKTDFVAHFLNAPPGTYINVVDA